MDPQASPPKRVTRARAAAKKQPKEPTIKIATASARALTNKDTIVPATTASLLPAAPITRRTRAASHLEGEESMIQQEEPILQVEKPKLKARGRPKRTTIAAMAEEAGEEAHKEEEEAQKAVAPALVKATRGRVKKIVEEDVVPAPIRSTRRKVTTAEDGIEEEIAPEPVKKTTRARPAVTSTTRASKKSVKFEPVQEDKENLPLPKPKVKDTPVNGFKAKPIRKAVPAARKTRGNPEPPSTELKSSPLSPKKITQVSPGKSQENNSDDELATMHKTPMKSLQKSPIKPPTSIMSAAHKLNDATTIATQSSIIANRVQIPDQLNLSASVLASPARRLPASPFKGSLKTNAIHGPDNGLLKSPFKPDFSIAKRGAIISQASFSSSLLQSPARRPPHSSKSDLFGSPSKCSSTPFKNSLLQSPAKRPASPIKGLEVSTLGKRAGPDSFDSTPKPSTFTVARFATPKTLNKNAFRPGKVLMVSVARPATEIGKDLAMAKPFSGRLSSVVPRAVDPVLRGPSIKPVTPHSRSSDEFPGGAAEVKDLETTQKGLVEEYDEDFESTTPVASPPRQSTGYYPLRSNELDPFGDETDNSGSEDELASGSRKYSPVPMRSLKGILATPVSKMSAKTPMTKTIRAQNERVGFTPLAEQLSNWMGATSAEGVEDIPYEQSTPAPLDSMTSISPFDQQDDIGCGEMSALPRTPTRSLFAEEMDIRNQELMDQELLVAENGNTTLDEILGLSRDVLMDEEVDIEAEIDAMTFAPQHLDDQDLELAVEAEEMSLLDFAAGEAAADEDFEFDEEQIEPDEFDAVEMEDDTHDELASEDIEIARVGSQGLDMILQEDSSAAGPEETDTSMSNTSQDYGDENAAPMDDVIVHSPEANNAPSIEATSPEQADEVTPRPAKKLARISYNTPLPRYSTPRVIHTTSKIPLKPAAADSPVKIQARSQTIVRPTAKRPAPRAPSSTQATPRKSSLPTLTTPVAPQWSPAATPAKTPRQSSAETLKGAVVFVDVYTVEGADASAVFVELLTTMGARCVRSWSWNSGSLTSSPEDASAPPSSSKIGITHVVFKDGGKRTIEKVREAGGVVACVGVGWVLDCERNNEWVSEAPYEIDTSLVPRGGHRRRKSMEPKALQALNNASDRKGAVTPRAVSYSSADLEGKDRGTQSATPKFNRRKSTAWVRSPAFDETSNPSGSASASNSTGLEAFAEETLLLSPAPQTPDEAEILRRVEECLDRQMGEPTPFNKRQVLMQQTVPVARHTDVEEVTAAGEAEDQRGVLMQRLLAARRKSLQWAPKVGSPLSRTQAFSP